MGFLILSVALLVASHLIPSAPELRAGLIARYGRRGFLVGYSLLSTVALALVVVAYGRAGPGWLYVPAWEARFVALAVMPLALFLLACRFLQPPSRMGGRGIYRITTTPGSLAVLAWAAVHLLNVGQTRTVVLFVGMAAIALVAILRNARRAGRGLTGAVPFAQVLSGRERLVPGEFGWRPLAVAIGLYVVLLALHPIVIGVDPLAGMF